jgi:hypothetical protein
VSRRFLQFREHVEALHGELLTRLLLRMTAADWTPDPAVDTSTADGVVGSSRRPLNEDFAVTARFAWFPAGGSLPPIQVDTVVGVSYERSYRVWPMLLGRSHTELRVNIARLGADREPVTVWDLARIEEAAGYLVAPVLTDAVAWAEPFASVEALLAAISSSGDDTADLADIPVVLAAAGRLDEARQALTSALPAHRSDLRWRHWQDFVAKFTAWLDAGGAVPDPPATIP